MELLDPISRPETSSATLVRHTDPKLRPLSVGKIGVCLLLIDVALIVTFTTFVTSEKIGMVDVNSFTNQILLYVAVICSCSYIFGLYQISPQLQFWKSIRQAAVATGVSAIVLAFFVYISAGWRDLGSFGRVILFLSLALHCISSASARWMLSKWLYIRLGISRWIVIGNHGSSNTNYFLNMFNEYTLHSEVNLLIPEATTEKITNIQRLRTAGYWEQIDDFLSRPISGIILINDIDIPDAIYKKLVHARSNGIKIYDLVDFTEIYKYRVPINRIQDKWFALSSGFDLLHNENSLRIKRLMDVGLASIILIMCFPLILMTAIIVKLTSFGPIIYKQTRIGLRGTPFTIYKFRSMTVNAEKDGAVWAIKGDPRITPFGKFMRMSRLDELPQLVNILRGDMSFIGPRPERPEFIAKLEDKIPYYGLRHLVKPGLTGWAQINAAYSSSIDETMEKIEYDLYYVKYYSLFLDLLIVLRTIRVVLFGLGAK